MKTRTVSGGLLFASLVFGLCLLSAGRGTGDDVKEKNTPKDAAVERARREVRMLDDIYKTAIVLVTTHYVNKDTDLPAGSAFKALFEAVEKRGGMKCGWSMQPVSPTAI